MALHVGAFRFCPSAHAPTSSLTALVQSGIFPSTDDGKRETAAGPAAGNAGSADPEDAGRRTAAWLRHRAAAEAALRRRVAGRRVFAVSGSASSATARLGHCR